MQETNLNWNEYAFLYDWELKAVSSHQTKDFFAWLKLCQRINGSTLELGCGSGRIAGQLAKKNINITALDSSTTLINKMRKNEPNFPPNKILLGDMTTYDFPEVYDFVFYSYSTFQYLLTLQDQINALLHIRKYLKKSAYIAFDICPYTCDLPQIQEKVLLYKRYNKDLESEVSMYTSHRVDIIKQITTWNDSYVIVDRKQNRKVIHHNLSLKGIRTDFLDLLLNFCGFKLIATYGDFDLGEVKVNSDNIIYLAQKIDN